MSQMGPFPDSFIATDEVLRCTAIDDLVSAAIYLVARTLPITSSGVDRSPTVKNVV
jgi:hypothetical protein